MSRWIVSIIVAFTILLYSPRVADSNAASIRGQVIDMKKFDVVIGFIRRHNKKVSYEEAYKITYISYMQKTKVLSSNLLIAQMKVESDFDVYAVGKAGEKGLPQIYHRIWKWYDPYNDIIRTENDLYSPERAIPAQVLILNHFLEKHNGNLWRAIRNYNGRYSIKTRNYVRLVLKYKKILEKELRSVI